MSVNEEFQRFEGRVAIDEIGWDVFEPEMEEFFALTTVEMSQELVLEEGEEETGVDDG